MYKSPIEIIQGQIQTQLEGNVLKAVQDYGINVDNDELIRALQYDRGQYKKGYADGKADAEASIVLCKDCKHRHTMELPSSPVYCKKLFLAPANDDDFCSYGERKD